MNPSVAQQEHDQEHEKNIEVLKVADQALEEVHETITRARLRIAEHRAAYEERQRGPG